MPRRASHSPGCRMYAARTLLCRGGAVARPTIKDLVPLNLRSTRPGGIQAVSTSQPIIPANCTARSDHSETNVDSLDRKRSHLLEMILLQFPSLLQALVACSRNECPSRAAGQIGTQFDRVSPQPDAAQAASCQATLPHSSLINCSGCESRKADMRPSVLIFPRRSFPRLSA